jgi:hypothetical protein
MEACVGAHHLSRKEELRRCADYGTCARAFYKTWRQELIVLTIKLLSGHSIHAEVIVAQRTYLTLLEGIPTDRINARIIAGVRELSKRVLFHDHCVIIPPVLTERKFNDKTWNQLPRTLIAGSFRCHDPVRGSDQHYSALAVAWFQPELEPLISDQALASIQRLDWDALAMNCSD